MEEINKEIEQLGKDLGKEIEQTVNPKPEQVADDKMNRGIGNKESEKLGAATVEILEPKLETVPVKDKESEIVECMVKHPDKEDLIKVSQVRFVKNDKITQSGMWYNEDTDKNIAKGSALAIFLAHVKAETVRGLTGLKASVEPDKNGYLAFKAY